jgi:predicted deacylase
MSGWSTLEHRDGDALIRVHRLSGAEPGPTLAVLGGVHGDEINGTLGASEVLRRLDAVDRGTIIVVPVANEAAQRAFRRETPQDGLNLARSFPGSPDGSLTPRVAALLTAHVIDVADALVDLHTSSLEVDMPWFAGCVDDATPLGSRSRALAEAFGAPLLWTHSGVGPGRSLSVAREREIPAMYVESPRGGIADAAVVDAYARGCLRVAAHLGLIPGDSAAPAVPPGRRVHGDGDTDDFTASSVAGFFVATVDLLDTVLEKSVVGHVVDALGNVLQLVEAPSSGLIVTLRRTAAVEAGTPLVGVAAPC